MGKLNNSVLILGEGPTEFFYLKSLADTFKHITIKPDYPKHTNLQELEQKIKEPATKSINHSIRKTLAPKNPEIQGRLVEHEMITL